MVFESGFTLIELAANDADFVDIIGYQFVDCISHLWRNPQERGVWRRAGGLLDFTRHGFATRAAESVPSVVMSSSG